MLSRAFWFRVMMMACVAVAALALRSKAFDESLLCAFFGMSAAIASRFWFREIFEWKGLIAMIAISSTMMLFFPQGSEVRLLSEFVFWWGICGIPLRVTLRQANKWN